MPKSPFFTIITATYNAECVLPSLLESLTAQTCRDFVWLVQDGASCEGTVALVEAWRQRLPALFLESRKDGGIYDAWNNALDRMRRGAGEELGQWVLFLGADDALASPDALEKARHALAAMPDSVLLASGGAEMWGQGAVEPIPGKADGACARLRQDMPFCHTALFHRASLFSTLRFDARYKVLGDYDLVCRALERDDQAQVVPYTITRMRRGGVSGSLCMQPAIFRESCSIALRHFGRLRSHHLKVGLKVAVVAALCRLLGVRKAERVMDEVRRRRGKPPVWHNPPNSPDLVDPPNHIPNLSHDGALPLHAASCAIVLVHYNNPEDTLACLASLQRLHTPPAHIAVVDNGSAPSAVTRLRVGWQHLLGQEALGEYAVPVQEALAIARPLPRHLLLLSPCNTGFSGGNNAALRPLLRHSQCAAFWLLNNDTLPDPGALDALCARLVVRSDAGLCGSTLLYAYAPERAQAAGGCRYSPWTGQTRFLRGGDSAAALAALTPGEVRTVEAQTAYVVGASCLIRRQVLEDIGLMPEEYFLYYEDVAFALESRRAGYGMAWARDSLVLHKEGASTHSGPASTPVRPSYVDYLSIRNRMAVIRRYSPWALPVALASLAGVALNRIRRGQVRRLGLIARAAWCGVTGKMGRAGDFDLGERER